MPTMRAFIFRYFHLFPFFIMINIHKKQLKCKDYFLYCAYFLMSLTRENHGPCARG